MEVLGIPISDELVARWREWFAPAAQPFFVSGSVPASLPTRVDRAVGPELRDTFEVWNVADRAQTVWLDEGEFASLERRFRAWLVRAQVTHGRGAVPTVRSWSDLIDSSVLGAQADGHRFVWWPSLLLENGHAVLERAITHRRLPSRHVEVAEGTWRRCAAVLPGARDLAGTFATASGPNCFGTVMAAGGITDAADAWMLQGPFDAWLEGNTSPGGEDGRPGTVLVWRDAAGVARHAAVTLGDGWCLEKASQQWSAPRAVVAVTDVIRTSRTRGLRLHRHTVRQVASGGSATAPAMAG